MAAPATRCSALTGEAVQPPLVRAGCEIPACAVLWQGRLGSVPARQYSVLQQHTVVPAHSLLRQLTRPCLPAAPRPLPAGACCRMPRSSQLPGPPECWTTRPCRRLVSCVCMLGSECAAHCCQTKQGPHASAATCALLSSCLPSLLLFPTRFKPCFSPTPTLALLIRPPTPHPQLRARKRRVPSWWCLPATRAST